MGERTKYTPGTFSWVDLTTTDHEGAKSFYGGLFGWEWGEFEGSPEPYFVITNQGHQNGGVRGLAQPGIPPNWLVYFAVEDIDAALAKVQELGGTSVTGLIDVG